MASGARHRPACSRPAQALNSRRPWTGYEVRELKPNNPRAIKKGEKQVDQYCRECDKEFGPGHKGKVETYD